MTPWIKCQMRLGAVLRSDYLQADQEVGCSSMVAMKGGYWYQLTASMLLALLLLSLPSLLPLLLLPLLLLVPPPTLFASLALFKSQRMKSIMASAKARASSSVRDAVRRFTNSSVKGSRAEADKDT